MSRKNSLKSLETSKSNGNFQSFLRQPTFIRNNRNKDNKLRLAKSNDTQNSSRVSDRSNRQNKIMRKRRKQPSESIDSSRNCVSKRGATLKLFNNCGSLRQNQSFSSTIICHKKAEQASQNQRASNVSHSEIVVQQHSSRLNKYQQSVTSFGMNEDKDKVLHIKKTKYLNGSLVERRPSGIVRPKTSIGRNHSLYQNVRKHNHSLIQSKANIENFLTNRSNSEQGNVEIIITEPLNEVQEIEIEQSVKEINGPSQGPPRLTKNYSLNTIFERK